MYPLPDKAQRKQIKRDRRAINRADNVFTRLNMDRHSLRAFERALNQIEQGMPAGGVSTVEYPVTDEVRSKQRERDRCSIRRGKEVVERVLPHSHTNNGDVLHLARIYIDECEKAAGLADAGEALEAVRD